MTNLDLLSVEARGTTYDPLKTKNKNRAIGNAIKAAKRAAASVLRRRQRSQGLPAGEWVYNIEGTSMTVDEMIDNGLIDVIRSRSGAQFASAKASFDAAMELEHHIFNRLTEGL